MTDLSEVEALTFDIGGTVFDWRGTIEEEVSRLAEAKSAEVDVRQFATDWRRGMFAMLARVRTGELPWMNADQPSPPDARRRAGYSHRIGAFHC